MINKFIHTFKRYGLVDANNDQIVMVGLRYFGSILMDFLFAVICSSIMGDIWVGILFQICYGMLRIYSGGYHAPNEKLCKYLTYASTLTSLLIVFTIPLESYIVYCIMIVLIYIIIFNSPIQNKNKPLNKIERKIYHRYCIEICVLELIFYNICLYADMVLYARTVCVAIVLVSIGVVVEKLRLHK